MSEIMEIIDDREKQKTKISGCKRLAQVIAKVWELNGFVVHLS